VPGRPAKVEMPTDWTKDEDAELLRAHEQFGKHPIILPYVLNKKLPSVIRKRSSKQCFDRIDALTGQGGPQGLHPVVQPVRPPPLPAYRAQVLSVPNFLEMPWAPVGPVKKVARAGPGSENGE
jgi:hypothetical protein